MFERAGIAHTGRWGQQKQIKRSSFLSDSRVVNHRGVVRTRAVCRGLWVSKLGRHPPPGHPLIHCGRRPHLFTTNIRQAVWATCHRAFNCLFLSPPRTCSALHTHTSFSVVVSPLVLPTYPPYLCLPCLHIFILFYPAFTKFLFALFLLIFFFALLFPLFLFLSILFLIVEYACCHIFIHTRTPTFQVFIEATHSCDVMSDIPSEFLCLISFFPPLHSAALL